MKRRPSAHRGSGQAVNASDGGEQGHQNYETGMDDINGAVEFELLDQDHSGDPDVRNQEHAASLFSAAGKQAAPFRLFGERNEQGPYPCSEQYRGSTMGIAVRSRV